MKLPKRTRVLLLIAVIFLVTDVVLLVISHKPEQSEYPIWNVPVEAGQTQDYRDNPKEEYTEAIIQYIEEDNVIQAETIDSDIAITFKVERMHSFLREGNILPIIIDCVKK